MQQKSDTTVEPKIICQRGRVLFNASEGVHDTHHGIEAAKIFLETQAKRLLHLLFFWDKRFNYSSRNETEADIYQHDLVLPAVNAGCRIQNLGHAAQLIQTAGINILTDPVFGNLNPLLYPAMTKAGAHPENLPPIDVILISHNHRDHADVPSLQKLLALKQQPIMLVPQNSGDLFTSLGFTHVHEMKWQDKFLLEKNGSTIELYAVPADHWSGRGLFDTNRSSVNGWLINPVNEPGLIYFAGDTAKLSAQRMQAITQIIGLVNKAKNKDPIIYNLEPGGPNYTRSHMQSTHQSVLESIASSLELAIYLHALEQSLETNAEKRKSAEQWLGCITTIFMHHNKYQLGPDRFNESIFIFKRTIQLLRKRSDVELHFMTSKERRKNFLTNFIKRNDAFIYEGVLELRRLARKIWVQETPERVNEKMIKFLKERTSFPKIGAAVGVDGVASLARAGC